uniref:NADH-ubiquinone oxidoreductase chain 3 n=1 Tax=Caloptilia theivora TaxID=914280 RepID=A0A6G6CE88_9NEOP|nr:NADH dehydrogenase subunit 3 [Caloptilia theivora]QID90520.1 NADH dehydrogenase subunit 3 [Caloptilia theivora]
MMMIFFMTILICLISNIMMMISTLISKKSFLDREKCSPFECGFDPKSKARMPFSLHFFLITVIFLIFDIEIALILPMIILYNTVNYKIWMMINIFFFFILLLGLYQEGNQNMLNWTN